MWGHGEGKGFGIGSAFWLLNQRKNDTLRKNSLRERIKVQVSYFFLLPLLIHNEPNYLDIYI